VSIPRAKLEWKKSIEKSIDPQKAESLYDKSSGGDDELCTMCGEFCAIRGTMRSREDYEKRYGDS
jgi:phosphomethylpyrimidine synthase